VYALVAVGVLVTQAGDREEDFHAVYDFVQEFDAGYVWKGAVGG
jgi:uncharacterized repeat protein (TIGR04138 family)